MDVSSLSMFWTSWTCNLESIAQVITPWGREGHCGEIGRISPNLMHPGLNSPALVTVLRGKRILREESGRTWHLLTVLCPASSQIPRVPFVGRS